MWITEDADALERVRSRSSQRDAISSVVIVEMRSEIDFASTLLNFFLPPLCGFAWARFGGVGKLFGTIWIWATAYKPFNFPPR